MLEKNKKPIKEIILSSTIIFFVVIFIFFLCDFCCYSLVYKKQIDYLKTNKNRYVPKFNYSLKLEDFNKEYKIIKQNDFRKPLGVDSNKKSIVVFGCSFAFGYVYPEEQTISYQLYKNTKRPVYNRAFCSWGIQHMLYQLRKKSFYKEIKNPDCFIYVFIPDHVRRMYTYVFDTIDGYNLFYLRYELKNKKLEEVKINKKNIFLGSSLYKEYQNMKSHDLYNNFKENKEKTELLKALFVESNKLLKTKYPDSRFVILKYDNSVNADQERYYLDSGVWDDLKKEGMIIISTKELTDKNLALPDYTYNGEIDNHPNGKAWEEIVPSLVQKLKL